MTKIYLVHFVLSNLKSVRIYGILIFIVAEMQWKDLRAMMYSIFKIKSCHLIPKFLDSL